MPSAFQTLAMSKSPIAAWPLEAASPSDISGNALHFTAVGTPGAAGPPLVAGGGASSTFDGATSGFQIPTGGTWIALGLRPTTSSFSFFGWFAPAVSAQASSIFGKSGVWQWGTKTNGQLVLAGAAGVSPGLYTAVPQASGQFASPFPWFVGTSFDAATAEVTTSVNGRYAYSAPLTSMADTGGAHIFVGAPQDGQVGFFNGSIGHFYIYNRAISLGEMAELHRVGTIGAPAPFTDIWDLQMQGIPGAGAKSISLSGVYQGAVTSPGNPLTAVTGSTAPKGPIQGHCASCGGRILSNEAQVVRSIGTGAGMGGVGTTQPMHIGCHRLRPLGVPVFTPSNPPTNFAQFSSAYARISYDVISAFLIRNTYNKSRYFQVNGLPDSASNPGGLFMGSSGSGYDIRDNFSLGVAVAMMHHYYKLPRNYWTRAVCELIMDWFVAQRQVPTGYSFNGFDLKGSGAIDWYKATAKGAQTTAYNTSDDFYFAQFGQMVFLMAPWLDPAKLEIYKQAFIAHANWYIGPGSNMTTYINPNRNLGPLLGIWLAWKMTGDEGYLQAYEGLWWLNATPPTFPSDPTPIIANRFPAWAALNERNWPGKAFTNYNSYPSTTGYGWIQVTAPSLADGSDGSGYFPESAGGVAGSGANPGPNGIPGPGFDGDYSQIQLHHLIQLWCWTKDPRYVKYTNMLVNYQLPLLDKTGGLIVFKNSPYATALGPATIVAGSAPLDIGSTVIPANLTSGMAFATGQQIVIGTGAGAETLTIAGGGITLGTPGSLTVTTPTTKTHAVGENIGQMTGSTGTFFSGWNLDAQLGARHNAIVQYYNEWPIISWANGLRAANPFTLADVQQQWGKMDAFLRQWAIQNGVKYLGNLQPWTVGALMGDPKYTPPTSLRA